MVRLCRSLTLHSRYDFFTDILRRLLVAIEMHRVRGAPLRTGPEIGRVAEHFRQRHPRLDDLRPAAIFLRLNLATPAGQANSKINQQKAEELYLKSLKLDNPVPIAHRGLAMLYEKTGRTKEAIDEYQKYLDLAPNALDRGRVQRRIQTLRGSGP